MDSVGKLSSGGAIVVLLFFLLSCLSFTSIEAYDVRDPKGNFTIKWDVLLWTPDGYVASVTMYNFQKFRRIPGWTLGWTWAKKEVIWGMIGALSSEQGDCSRFKGNVPYSCKNNPIVVDLLPGTPYSQQVANCCKRGVMTSWFHNPAKAVSAFQVSVGAAGTTKKSVTLPNKFTLRAPGSRYTCGLAKIVRPTRFISADKRRVTQALMTWNITCKYSGHGIKP